MEIKSWYSSKYWIDFNKAYPQGLWRKKSHRNQSAIGTDADIGIKLNSILLFGSEVKKDKP